MLPAIKTGGITLTSGRSLSFTPSSRIIAAIGVLYVLSGLATLSMTNGIEGTAAVWPANAIVLGAVMRYRGGGIARLLATEMVASLIVNLVSGTGVATAVGFSVANTSETFIAWQLARRWCGADFRFLNVADIVRFSAAALLASACGTIIVCLWTWALGVSNMPFLTSWLTTDWLGMLVVTPLLLLSRRVPATPSNVPIDRSVWLAGLVTLLLISVTVGVFIQSSLPLMFLPPIALLFATLTMGGFGAVMGTLLIASIGSWCTMYGIGGVARIGADHNFNLLFFQFYLFCVFASALPVAALLATRDRLAQTIADSERIHRNLIERSSAAIFEVDSARHWTFLSVAWQTLTGRTVDATLGDRLEEAFHPVDKPVLFDCLAAIDSGDTDDFSIDVRLAVADGEWRWVTVRAHRFADRDCLSGSIVDIDNQKKIALALACSEARYRLLAENATDIIFQLDRERRFVYISPSVEALTGYPAQKLIGVLPTELVHREDLPLLAQAVDDLMEGRGDIRTVTYRTLCVDGSWLWIEVFARIAEVGGAHGVVGVGRNVSERKATERALIEARETAENAERIARSLAETDQLTGVSSRRAFLDRLEREIQFAHDQRRTVSVAIFDVDFFKRVNDCHGHATGDEVLRRIAESARTTVRGDDLVGRLGGEEFGIIMPGSGSGTAAIVGERVRAEVERDATAGLSIDAVTISVGVATLELGGSGSELLAAADTALYEAKRSGRNRLCLAA